MISAPPLLMSAPEAAEYLGVSRTRLFELQADGTMPGVKVGGRRYWRRQDLDAFVDRLA